MTDAKIATIYDNYKQFGSVKYLPKKVEDLRKRTTLYGIGASLGIFFLNEVSRFTLRSPIFKLRPLPVLIVAALPTGFLRYYSSQEIDKEVLKFWRVHKTREEKGMGGSYRPSGIYPNQVNHVKRRIMTPLHTSFEEIYLGVKTKSLVAGANIKLNDGIAEANHNAFHEDWDKQTVYTKIYEANRAKLRAPKEGTTKMNWFYHSIEDTDQKVAVGGIDNDNPFHEPPDSGFGPTVDHKLDERDIFSFQKTSVGRELVYNLWRVDPKAAAMDTGAPVWGDKLLNAPSYFTEASAREFLAQVAQRKEFSLLKRKWAHKTPEQQSMGEKAQEAAEYQSFVDQAYEDKGNFEF